MERRQHGCIAALLGFILMVAAHHARAQTCSVLCAETQKRMTEGEVLTPTEMDFAKGCRDGQSLRRRLTAKTRKGPSGVSFSDPSDKPMQLDQVAAMEEQRRKDLMLQCMPRPRAESGAASSAASGAR